MKKLFFIPAVPLFLSLKGDNTINLPVFNITFKVPSKWKVQPSLPHVLMNF
ncbi:MAG: hypothetical protein HY064_04435 [Bacteroidetes bacterium]|nr:hypothetical protein [Bacteroidota bacterium]